MKNLLKKCIEELAKPEPKLDYVRGILETLAEQEVEKPVVSVPPLSFTPAPNVMANPHGIPPNEAFKVLSDNPIQNG